MRSPKSVDVDATMEDYEGVHIVDTDGRGATVVHCNEAIAKVGRIRRDFRNSARFQTTKRWGVIHDGDETLTVTPQTKEWIQERVDLSWLTGKTVLIEGSTTVLGSIVSIEGGFATVKTTSARGAVKLIRPTVANALKMQRRYSAGTVTLTATNADGIVSTKECT